jgi:hypothetical protein
MDCALCEIPVGSAKNCLVTDDYCYEDRDILGTVTVERNFLVVWLKNN